MGIHLSVSRKTFLIAEPIPYEGISTRKLVLETAYFNVLTAYSVEDLLETVQLFPAIDAVVLHTELPRYSKKVMTQLRKLLGPKPIILLSSSGHHSDELAEVVLTSHDPQLLLATIRDYFGNSDVSKLRRPHSK